MIERSEERIKITGEVFTPRDLIDEIFDRFPLEIWKDPSKRWLEPSCGDGNFLVAILERLMDGLREVIPDDEQRHKHIIEEMLFGVDIMPDNVQVCIERLGASGLSHNIVCADSLEYDFSFGRPEILADGLIEIPAGERTSKPSKISKPEKYETLELPSDLFG